MNALTRWWERRKYRRVVLANMSWLLVRIPVSTLKKILSSYPGTRSSADSAFEAGSNVNEESVRVVATVMADVVMKCVPVSARKEILQSLGATSKPKPATSEIAQFWIEVIRTMEGNAYAMVQSGKIEIQWCDILMSEVVGALDGQSAQERSRRRLFRVIDDAFVSKPDA